LEGTHPGACVSGTFRGRENHRSQHKELSLGVSTNGHHKNRQ
jgi:hypothetical protein